MDEAAELPGVPAGMLDQAAGVRQMARQLVGRDLRKVQDVARLAAILPTAQRVTQLAGDLAESMRAASAGIIAAAYQAGHEAAIAGELARRAGLQAAGLVPPAQPAATGTPAKPRPAQTLDLLAPMPRPVHPPPPALPGGGLHLQMWHTPPITGPPPRREPAARVRSVTAMLAAAQATGVTLPARDTSVGEFVQQETRRRETAGLPPLTGAEMVTLVLSSPPRRPQPPQRRRGRFRRRGG